MKLLSLDNQFVADFSPHNQDYNLVSLHMIQGPQVSRAQLELGQRIGAQPFDCLRRRGWLVLETG
jgi:hypothetical protein